MIQDIFFYMVKNVFGSDVGISVPIARGNLPNFGPKPPVHPFGPGYSMYPELTRSAGPALYYGGAAALVGYAYASSMIAESKAIGSITASEGLDTQTKIRFLSGY